MGLFRCGTADAIVLKIDVTALTQDARARLRNSPFSLGIFGLAPDGLDDPQLKKLGSSRSRSQYIARAARFKDYEAIFSGFGLPFDATWVSRRGLGRCWVSLPALTGSAVAGRVKSETAAVFPKRRAPSAPGAAEAVLQNFAASKVDLNDSFPAPSATTLERGVVWTCTDSRNAQESTCAARAALDAPWVDEAEQITLLLIGTVFALAAQMTFETFWKS